MSLNTVVEGSPGAVAAVADWLRATLAARAEELGSTAFRERSRSGSSWEGAAGDAFRGRVGTLGSAADDAAAEARAVAGVLDALASAMRRVQDGMAAARAEASAGGLTVRDSLIDPPGPVPPPVPALAPDAPPGAVAAYERGMAAIAHFEALVEVWERVRRRVDAEIEEWNRALEDAAATWNAHRGNLTGVTADFLTAGVTSAYVLKMAPILAGQAAFESSVASGLRAHAAATVRDGRLVGGSRAAYYDLLDRAAAAEARAATAAESARSVKVPSALGRALGVLGVGATVYAAVDDVQHGGESPAQAAVSNGAGFVAAIGASAAAGAGIGAVAGSFIPVPGVGTAVGVVGGAVVGTVVGTFTSGAVDSLWESGADSLGDVGNAVADGWEEVADTGAAIGDLAEDAWDAIF